jgi:hypothetical protein
MYTMAWECNAAVKLSVKLLSRPHLPHAIAALRHAEASPAGAPSLETSSARKRRCEFRRGFPSARMMARVCNRLMISSIQGAGRSGVGRVKPKRPRTRLGRS